MVFPLIAAAVTAGSTMYAANQAKKSAKMQAKGIDKNIAFQKEQADRAYEMNRPFIDAGKGYLDIYNNMMGLGGQEGQQSALDLYRSGPSYSLLQDLTRQISGDVAGTMAANGLLRSGAYGNELLGRLSPTILNDYYKYQSGVGSGVDMGRMAAGQAAGQAMQHGRNVGQAYSDQGTVNAAGAMGQANAIQQGTQNLLGIYANQAGRQSAGYPLQYDPTWSNTTTTGYL